MKKLKKIKTATLLAIGTALIAVGTAILIVDFYLQHKRIEGIRDDRNSEVTAPIT